MQRIKGYLQSISKTQYSKIFRIQQKVIFADLIFITPSSPENGAGLTFITLEKYS